MPTGDGIQGAGAFNQYLSIWKAVGAQESGFSALRNRLDGVLFNFYWSGTESALPAGGVWYFNALFGGQDVVGQANKLSVVAVRPGDVAAAVPEPQTLALALALALALPALDATVVARRR